MKFDGTINIQTPRKDVWEFLTNPHAVSMCAPGLEALKVIEPDKKFQAMTRLSLGTVKVRFTLDIEWTELNKPDSAAMKARGTTPASDSSTDIVSKLTLTDGPNNSTNISWEAEVTVVGKIASLAARLMNVVTRQLTDEFFTCVKSKIEKGDDKAVRVVESKDVAQAIETAKVSEAKPAAAPEAKPATNGDKAPVAVEAKAEESSSDKKEEKEDKDGTAKAEVKDDKSEAKDKPDADKKPDDDKKSDSDKPQVLI